MWLSDDVLMVLFDGKDTKGPYAVPLEFISNKEKVQQYLDSIDSIPYIQKTFRLKSTKSIQLKDYIHCPSYFKFQHLTSLVCIIKFYIYIYESVN